MEIKNEQLEILEGEVAKIHPALDFTDKFAIVTVPLLSGLKDENDKLIDSKKVYWCVTSKGELFLLNDSEFFKRNFYKTTNCFIEDSRWQYKSIKEWVGGDILIPHPKRIYREIKTKLEYFLDYVDPRQYTFIALWIYGTYFHQIFDAYPIVFLNGITGSGKSKTIELAHLLAFNAIFSANISDASIYRIITSARPTLLLDENEKISRSEEGYSQINLLLASFKRNGAKVIRCEKGGKSNEKFFPTSFELFSPKIIANIRGIDIEALKNRCVTFIMSPSQTEKANRWPVAESGFWQTLRNMAYLSLMAHWEDIKILKRQVLKEDFGLKGYYFMMWHPIFTMAKLIGEDVLKEMVDFAKEKTEEHKAEIEESYDRKLLLTIYEMFQDGSFAVREIHGKQFIPTSAIYYKFLEKIGFTPEDRPEWLTTKVVGKMIRPLNIGEPKQENIQNRPTRGYWIAKERLSEMVTRFGIAIK